MGGWSCLSGICAKASAQHCGLDAPFRKHSACPNALAMQLHFTWLARPASEDWREKGGVCDLGGGGGGGELGFTIGQTRFFHSTLLALAVS